MRNEASGRKPGKRRPPKGSAPSADSQVGAGGELHQTQGGEHPAITTNQGVAIADNQNSLRATPRGPTLIEDFILREKIMHFDHERIPERIVHARATGAHGFFELTASLKHYTTARILTEVGEKAPEQYDFSRLSGQRTAFAWHVAHFKDPRALVIDTVMPNFHLSTREAQALAMLVMSWRRLDVPAAYVSGTPQTDPVNAEEAAAEQRMKTGPGAWFVQTGCFVCHSIAVLGVRSPAQIGPDLSNAVEDVQSRFGRTIDDFLAAPTGTMAVVLSRQIVLTPEQKAVAIQKLRDAFAEYQKQKAAGTKTPAAPMNP